MEMPRVSRCEVGGCAYNMEDHCYAMAITVGDSMNPHCDTMCMSDCKCSQTMNIAGVGACKTSKCVHNQGLECGAPEISVGLCDQNAECLTFKSR